MAMTWDKGVKILSAVAGAVAGFFGEWNTMLTMLAVVMVLDYVSGWIVALRKRSPKTEHGGLSSKIGFDGLAKKAVIIIILIAATSLDKVLNTGSMAFQTATCFYYLANEMLSILENAALMGVPFPDGFKQALEALKKKGDGGVDAEEPPDGE